MIWKYSLRFSGHFGKYLNEYDGSYIPAGWHRWVGLIRNSRFYNYTLRHNTFFRRHSNVYKRDYFTDVITNHSLAFFRQAKARNPDRPILMGGKSFSTTWTWRWRPAISTHVWEHHFPKVSRKSQFLCFYRSVGWFAPIGARASLGLSRSSLLFWREGEQARAPWNSCGFLAGKSCSGPQAPRWHLDYSPVSSAQLKN